MKMIQPPTPIHNLQFKFSPRWIANAYSSRSYIQRSLFNLKHHKKEIHFNKRAWKALAQELSSSKRKVVWSERGSDTRVRLSSFVLCGSCLLPRDSNNKVVLASTSEVHL